MPLSSSLSSLLRTLRFSSGEHASRMERPLVLRMVYQFSSNWPSVFCRAAACGSPSFPMRHAASGGPTAQSPSSSIHYHIIRGTLRFSNGEPASRMERPLVRLWFHSLSNRKMDSLLSKSFNIDAQDIQDKIKIPAGLPDFLIPQLSCKSCLSMPASH